MKSLRIVPLTPRRWNAFESLFGPRGACGGCWCMTPRLSRADYERLKGDGARRRMKRLVDSGRVTGVLAMAGGTPVGWCSIEPREKLPWLSRSRILAPVDDAAVWSIVCFFIDRPFRGRGLSVALIRGAVRHARARGAKIVEAYPVEPAAGTIPTVFAWTGFASAFRKAGFREVARRSATRPIMRRVLRSRRARAASIPVALVEAPE